MNTYILIKIIFLNFIGLIFVMNRSEDAKNSIDYETVNKLSLSLKIKKTSKGIKELSTVLDK